MRRPTLVEILLTGILVAVGFLAVAQWRMASRAQLPAHGPVGAEAPAAPARGSQPAVHVPLNRPMPPGQTAPPPAPRTTRSN